jgi:multidrug efflux system membrane fusion protein
MNYRRSLVIVALFTAALGAALSGCGRGPDSSTQDKPPVVRVVEPKVEDVQFYELFTGRSVAPDKVDIQIQVTGYLEEVLFKPGQEVHKGDLLFRIDSRTYKAQWEEDKAHVDLSDAQMKLAKAEYNRAMQAGIGTSAADKEKAAATQDSAVAALAAAKQAVAKSKLDLDFCEVKADIDGIIGRNLITVGNLVTKNTTLLATIVSEDPMNAYFDVDERTMLRIQEAIREGKVPQATENTALGMVLGGPSHFLGKNEYRVEFGLTTEGDQYPHEGHIDFVNNEVDTSTGTINVRGVLPNPKPKNSNVRLLKPGLFLRVRVPIGPPRKSMLVPQAAVGTDQGKKFLLVVNDKSVVEYRPINAGPIQPNAMQVVEPLKIVKTDKGTRVAGKDEGGEDSLKPGDKVIVSGLQRVRQGVTVEARPYAGAEE